jgi:2,3-bisphosphoglycerate-independent phosphoglycerate mutase
MVLPDHPTPIETRTHAMEPVPFFIYDSRTDKSGVSTYTEDTCEAAGFYISDGSTLLSHLIEK